MEDSIMLITYSFDISLCRIVEGVLFPSRLNLKAGIDVLNEDKVNAALQRINYWIDNYLNGSLVVNVEEIELVLDREDSPQYGNVLVFTPDIPSDDHLSFLLQNKINALANGAFEVDEIEISSDTAKGWTINYIGDSAQFLPDMDEWIGGPSWFDRPWWHRNDSSTIDTIAPEGSDLSQKPFWADDMNQTRHAVAPTEGIVLKGNFTPRVVDDE